MCTIQEKATEMLGFLETKPRDEKRVRFVVAKSEAPEWVSNIIWKAHDDRLANDHIYLFIEDVLQLLSDSDDPEEAIYELEADIYTSDLTGWLNDNVNNVCYLTDALDNNPDIKDGFQLLTYAQYLHRLEVGQIVLQELTNLTEQQ